MSNNTTRHSDSDSVQKSTYSHTLVSLGTQERKVLKVYLDSLRPRSKRQLAPYLNIPRSTLYDILRRLSDKGLLTKQIGGTYDITPKGKAILGIQTDVDCRDAACRGRDNLSQHNIRFKLNIKERGYFHLDDLSKLGDVQTPVKMQGWEWHRVLVDGNEIRVFPNEVLLYISEVIASDVEHTQLLAMNKAIDLALQLEKIGLVCDGMKLDSSHYERLGSLLADVLVKKLGKYYYQLPDGKAFWIDFSGETFNDESNDAKLRERLDNFVQDLPYSKSNFSDVDNLVKNADVVITDIDGLKKVAHLTLAASQNMLRMQVPQSAYPQPIPKSQRTVSDYVG
jgi:predicted transcriptional regulator